MRTSRTSLVLVLGFIVPLMSAVPAMAVQPSRSATVTVVHGLPNFTADIYVNGKLLLDGFKPTSEAGPLELRPAVYHLAIRNVGASPSSKPVLAGSVRLRAGGNYSIVAHLDGNGKPALSAYRNPEAPIPPGQAQVVVRAVATLPPVTLEANGEQLVSDVAPGGQRSALVPPGSYEIKVLTHGRSNPVLPAQDLQFREGSAYVLYVVGSGRDHSLDLMVQPLRGLASPPSAVQSGTGGLTARGGVSAWMIWTEVLVGAVLVMAGIIGLRRRSLPAH